MFWVNCAINMIAFDWEKKKENENKFGEEKMLRKSKEKEGKGKELGVVMELNRRENTKEKVLFDLFLFY